jgi:membrane protease YdiL (CAAX protease family)
MKRICRNGNIGLFYFIFFMVLGIICFIIKIFYFKYDISISKKMILTSVIIFPIIEEWTFRGVIQNYLSLKIEKIFYNHISLANILTSIIFSLIHLFENSFLHSLAVFLPSIIFGILYEKCGNIYMNMILHAFYNFNIFII